MRRASIASRWVAVVVILAGSGRVLAADAETADSGGNKPITQPGSTAEIGWNPINPCTTSSTNIYDLLRCLGGGIDRTFLCAAQPGGPARPIYPCPYSRGDYTVRYLDPSHAGIRILRNDGSEADKLFLRENDPHIQWTTISVNRPGLVGRIKVVSEAPSPVTEPSHLVSIAINDLPPVVVTTNGLQATEVNNALVAELAAEGYIVEQDFGWIIVSSDYLAQEVTKVSFRSTDPAIVTSELRIEPYAASDEPIYLGPPRGGIVGH